MSDLLFGYRTAPVPENSRRDRTTSIELYGDGTLMYRTLINSVLEESRVQFQVSRECVRTIQSIIDQNRKMLADARRHLNASLPTEQENVFIFDGIYIIDWNKIRSDMEELYEKNPDELRRPFCPSLEENDVMQVFQQICRVLQEEDLSWNRLRYLMI